MLYVLVNGGLVPADEAPEVTTPVPEIPQDVVDSIVEFVPALPDVVTQDPETPAPLSVPVALPDVPEIK